MVMKKQIALAFSALFFLCLMLLSLKAASSVPDQRKIDVTFACGSGFSGCSTGSYGICSPQPYLPMSNNQYTFNFNAPKAGAYTCKITATENHFDYPEGGPQELNEVTEISLNSKVVGKTVDSLCPPGGVPCAKPIVCDCSSSTGCTQKYKGDCMDGCNCPCQSYESSWGTDVLYGGKQNFQDRVCFKITSLSELATQATNYGRSGEIALVGLSSTTDRQLFEIVYGGGKVFTRFLYCFNCPCSNWCGVPVQSLEAVEGHAYKIEKSGANMIFSDTTAGRSVTLSPGGDVTSKGYIQANFDRYCMLAGCSTFGPSPYSHPFFPFINQPGAIELSSDCTGGAPTCNKNGVCDGLENTQNCKYDCCKSWCNSIPNKDTCNPQTECKCVWDQSAFMGKCLDCEEACNFKDDNTQSECEALKDTYGVTTCKWVGGTLKCECKYY